MNTRSNWSVGQKKLHKNLKENMKPEPPTCRLSHTVAKVKMEQDIAEFEDLLLHLERICLHNVDLKLLIFFLCALKSIFLHIKTSLNVFHQASQLLIFN